MSDIVERLVKSERISEWVDPYDQRLVDLTGEEPPADGGEFRELWEVTDVSEQEIVAREVGRLLIPEDVQLNGSVDIAFTNEIFGHDMGEGVGNVVARFANRSDWSSVFPTDRAVIFSRNDGRTAWGAVGLCGSLIGLAVFSHELENGSVQARIQVVPDEALEQITGVSSSYV